MCESECDQKQYHVPLHWLWPLCSLSHVWKCDFWVLERRVSSKVLLSWPEVILFSSISLNGKISLCVYVYAYMHICVYIHMHVCICTCVCLYTWLCIDILAYLLWSCTKTMLCFLPGQKGLPGLQGIKGDQGDQGFPGSKGTIMCWIGRCLMDLRKYESHWTHRIRVLGFTNVKRLKGH